MRIFLQAALTKKGFRQELPVPIIMDEIQLDPEPDTGPEDYLSIALPYTVGRMEKKELLLDINFQSGQRINCIVSKFEGALLESLKPGAVYKEVQLNGIDMITFCSVRLKEISKIKVGKHAGDTTITMQVLDD